MGSKDGGDSDGQCLTRDLRNVILKEAGICKYGFVCQGLDSGSGRQRRSRLVERKMTVCPNAAQKELDTAILDDFLLVLLALGVQIRCVTVEDVHLVRGDVNVAEEVLVHEAVVTFGVILGNADVFIHIEGYDMFEGDATGFVGFDEELVDTFWTASCRQAEDEGALRSRGEVIDAFFSREKLVSIPQENRTIPKRWILTDDVFCHIA